MTRGLRINKKDIEKHHTAGTQMDNIRGYSEATFRGNFNGLLL